MAELQIMPVVLGMLAVIVGLVYVGVRLELRSRRAER
jgi:hypothetical protein